VPILLVWGLLIALASTWSAPLQAAPDQLRLQFLSNDPFWLSLGHYEQTKLGAWRSHVDDERFFLSEQGAHDPRAELLATLDALYASPSLADLHAQCIYPARTRWLREQLKLDDLPKVSCKAFDIWFQDINPHRVALIFPAAYLNSPSSIFGHTLLRIDPPELEQQGSSLLSYALNFGATIEGEDNGILYAWKGLMGGYPGQFALLSYREKIAEYSRLENRDLWEYSLNLSQDETARMVEHVWELKQIRFDYFFFDENCSYRVLELLEVARPGLRLTEGFSLTAIPTDTVKAVEAAQLVDKTYYRPSRERELQAREVSLSPEERLWAKRLTEDEQVQRHPDFLALPTQRRALIQDGAYRLLRYRATGQERDSMTARHSYALLRAIQSNPPPSLDVQQPALPETGHNSRTLSLELGQREEHSYAEYRLRMAYHDLNDNLNGFPLGAQIEIAQIAVRQYETGHWQLQQLQLAGIRSMTPRTELLKPLSWQVTGGFERVPDDQDGEVLVGHLNGGAGFTTAWSDDWRGFALGTARLETNRHFGALIAPALGFNTGVLWRNDWGNMLLEAKGDYFHNGEARRQLQVTQQFELSPALGLRFSAKREFSQHSQPVSEAGLALRWYFY